MDTGVYTETLKPTAARASHFSSDEGAELYECWIATIRNCERRGVRVHDLGRDPHPMEKQVTGHRFIIKHDLT